MSENDFNAEFVLRTINQILEINTELKSLKSQYSCDRCGEYAHGACMAGGYNCVLCLDCRNRWHEVSLCDFDLLHEDEALLASAINNPNSTRKDVVIISMTVRSRKRDIYEKAKAFVTGEGGE